MLWRIFRIFAATNCKNKNEKTICYHNYLYAYFDGVGARSNHSGW